MKIRRCEAEKMRCRPPLLEEPCAQTLSGITVYNKNRITPGFSLLGHHFEIDVSCFLGGF